MYVSLMYSSCSNNNQQMELLSSYQIIPSGIAIKPVENVQIIDEALNF